MVATWTSGEKVTSSKLNRLLVIGRGQRDTTSSIAASSTEVGVLRLDSLAFKTDYLYKISLMCHPNSTVATDVPFVTMRYSTSGNATTSSTLLPGGRAYNLVPLCLETTLSFGADTTVSIIVTIARNTGTGNCTIFADGTRSTRLVVSGIGIDPGDTGVDL